MPDERDPQSPEVLLRIHTAEHEVEAMLRAAERDAAAIIERARVQADAMMSEKRRALEEKKKEALAQGFMEAAREAEQLIENAQAKAGALKTRCMARMDEAAELVLRRVLPAFQMTED
jgi:vacuolar-type H+-ATPase subunit H